MSEQEWEGTDPWTILRCFREINVSDRKLRLLGYYCCKHIENLLFDNEYLELLKLSEAYADDGKKIARIDDLVDRLSSSLGYITISNPIESARRAVLSITASRCPRPLEPDDTPCLERAASHAVFAGADVLNVVALLREIVGNPFRSVTIDPRRLTSTVVDLATAIYDERAFDRVRILADALLDAGCDNEEIIAHCRSKETHVRGCWVVDLILGKL